MQRFSLIFSLFIFLGSGMMGQERSPSLFETSETNKSNQHLLQVVKHGNVPNTKSFSAVLVNLEAAKDATIFSEDSNGSNGAGDLFTGRTNQPANRRTLIQFDLSSIPANATITSASLMLTGSKQSTSVIDAFRLTADWGEGSTTGMGNGGGIPSPAQENDATWSHGFFNTTAWASPGGDFVDQSSARSEITNNSMGIWSGDNIVADVQMWINGDEDNFGWILIADESTNGTAVRMESRGSNTGVPALQIEYEEGAVECEVSGGKIEGGPFAFCVGDGNPDMINEDEINLTGNSGPNSQWVITDVDGKILGLPMSFTDVNFDSAGIGTCLIYHLSSDGEIEGLEKDKNLDGIVGCIDVSNVIEVNRSQPKGGTLEGGPFSFCVGDDIEDKIPADAISLSGNEGTNSQWVVTFPDGSIAGLPPSFADVNFDGAGTGVCSVWHLSYEDGLEGLTEGAILADIVGCYSLSNAIEVNRTQPEGGTLEGGPFSFCVGDDIEDRIPADAISLSGNEGTNSQWVVTFPDGSIAGLPPSFADVNFDGAGTGVCSVWHLSYEDGLEGLAEGAILADIVGCYSLSNAIEVNRTQPEGGTLEGGPFAFCVGDDIEDKIPADAISLSGNEGTNSQWVVTFPDGSIAGLPPSFADVNFDGAGTGVCSVWHLSYEEGLEGLAEGAILADIVGCYSLSNAIEVNRTQPEGGTLEGGPFAFCVGDDIEDKIPADAISLSGNEGTNSQWVVTFPDGSIAGLPPSFADVNFDGAGTGVCSVWHLSYEDGLEGLTEGAILADIVGCYSLSNAIEVNRTQPEGGTLEGGPFAFCVGDDIEDKIPADAISLSGNEGTNSQWVVTFPDGSIAGLPPSFADVNFDGAGTGVCSVWHLSYEDGLEGLAEGAILADIVGCYSLSNAIEVTRVSGDDCAPDCAAVGGTIEGGPFAFCVGDDIEDRIPADAISLSGNEGTNSQWVVTFPDGSIAGLPPSFADVNFDGAGTGVCSVWHLSYEEGLEGLAEGAILADIVGCYSLSNAIEVNRTQPEGGTLEGGPFAFCVGDDIEDKIPADAISLSGNEGTNSQWVVTFPDGSIAGLPPSFADVNFDGAGTGVCSVWHLSYEDGLEGLAEGAILADIVGCYSLSNAIEVNRTQPEGGTLEGGPFAFCVGDDIEDRIPADAISLSGNEGTNSQWVVTFPDGSIAGLPPSFADVNFDGAGTGVCSVWHLSYEDGLEGLTEGAILADIVGCYSLSNAIEVNRTQPEGGTLEGGPFAFCVGDDIEDKIPADAISLSGNEGTNSQWVVTFPDGSIAGLPPSFADVNFDGAGTGVCSVWHLSYEDGLEGLAEGAILADIVGCYSLSNAIEVTRVSGDDCAPDCAAVGGTIEGGPFSFCVGDDIEDKIPADAISLSGNEGTNSQWVVTFPDGSIAGLPPSFADVNFDGAGTGVCSVWHLSYEDGLEGLTEGAILADIVGCYSLSNAIEVNRTQPEGGTLEGGPFSFCVGDDIEDKIPADAISLSGNEGTNSQWVVTFPDGSIAGLPPSFADVNFDGAGTGVCSVWHLSYEDGLEGLAEGAILADIVGCYSLSNAIEVTRVSGDDCAPDCAAVGGTIEGGPFAFCVGDDIEDRIPADAISLSGNEGTNSQWVVTFPDGSIAGLPPSFADVNFDGAGTGVCSVWHLSYEDGLEGLAEGAILADIVGCYSLSNAIEVNRTQPEGGTLEGGPFSFCVGDDIEDKIPADAISLSGNEGTNSQWVVTFPDGSIAGLPPSFADVNFDGAGTGVCSVWHLSYEDGLEGLAEGAILADIVGCYSLSNAIEVTRVSGDDCPSDCSVAGGILDGGPFTFCVGDGNPDMIGENELTLSSNSGDNSRWVVTDSEGMILGLPESSFTEVNFDGAGTGTCLVWHLSYDGDILGAELGANASGLEGCFSLSNPISVNRISDGDCTNTGECDLNGGDITTASGLTSISLCVGDGRPDLFDTRVSHSSGSNSKWVITSEDLTILGVQSGSRFNFESVGVGVCLIWHLSYEDGLTGAELGLNAGDLEGCYDLSNSITVNRLDCNDVCHTPLNLRVIESGSKRITVKWSKVALARGYEILIGHEGKPNSFVNIPVRSNKVKITHRSDLALVISVRAICRDGSVSDYTDERIYSPQFNGDSEVRSNFSSEVKYGDFGIVEARATLSPNPARNYLNISYDHGDRVDQISVWNVQGKKVLQTLTDPQVFSQRLDISGLNDGIFIMTISDNGELLHTERFIKTK